MDKVVGIKGRFRISIKTLSEKAELYGKLEEVCGKRTKLNTIDGNKVGREKGVVWSKGGEGWIT